MKRIKMLALMLALMLVVPACAVRETAPTETVAEFTVAVPTEPVTVPELTTVEITTDNWQDYFELRQTEQVQQNEACAVINRVFGYGIFLKEEYTDRMDSSTDVSFQMGYDLGWRRLLGDLNTNSYMVQGEFLEGESHIQEVQLTDFRGDPQVSEESDFHGSIAAAFSHDAEYIG